MARDSASLSLSKGRTFPIPETVVWKNSPLRPLWRRSGYASTGSLKGLICAIFAILVLAPPVEAQDFPKLSGRVVDAANIIPDDQEPALVTKLAALEAASTRQLVVATIPDLGSYPIEDYGYRLGRAWAVGQKEANNGTLLIIAPNDRKTRIEVGYGLEPILTDAFSSVVINTQMIPKFRDGDYPGGINAGVDALATQLQLPMEEAERRAQAMDAQQSDGDSGSAAMFWVFIFFFFILPMIWPLFFGRKRGRRFGGGPVVIWGGGSDWGGGGSSSGWGGDGGFSGGGGSFGGGGASGGW